MTSTDEDYGTTLAHALFSNSSAATERYTLDLADTGNPADYSFVRTEPTLPEGVHREWACPENKSQFARASFFSVSWV
jgi:hypothetical protein